MSQGIRLSDDERQRIIDLLPSGRSRNAIAKETGFSHDTVGRIARSVGHRFGQQNLAHAREVAAAYGAEWRADFAKRLSAKCDDLLKDMDSECLVYSFGGRDNVYAEETLARPPHADRLKLMQAIRMAAQTILEIDRHDSAVGILTDVQEYLSVQKGERPS